MNKIFISLSMLALGFMTSCQQEVLFNEASQVESSLEFTASLEGKATSRTQLSPLDEENNIYKVWWSEKDALSVHESENSHARYIIKKGVGTVCGTFRWAGGDMIAGTESWNGDSKMYVGVYPHSDATTIEKNEKGFRIYTEIPTVQTFAEGSCGENALPMVAVCKDYDFAFKNVGAIIILPLKGETKIASATLESKAHKIAGKAIVTANKEDKWIPTIDVTNGENKVVVDCGDGVELKADEATKFFFVMAPGTYEANDLSIKFTDIQGNDYVFKIPFERTYKRSNSTTFLEKTFKAQN